MRNDRNVMVNFEPGEYIRKSFFSDSDTVGSDEKHYPFSCVHQVQIHYHISAKLFLVRSFSFNKTIISGEGSIKYSIRVWSSIHIPETSGALIDSCFSSACFFFPSHSHNAPAAAFFNSLLFDVRSFRNSAMADSIPFISFLFSSSKAKVHNVLHAFSSSVSSSAFCNIETRTGMAPLRAICNDKTKSVWVIHHEWSM